jgi:protein-tyrosine phosphatase
VTPGDSASLVDIHSHLVPEVDDGARSVQAVLDSVERLIGCGIRRIVTTPHLRGSLTLDASALAERLGEVDEAFATAAAALRERAPAFEYLRGHEVMVDEPEVDFSDPRLRMAGTTFVLIEWPRLHVPPGTPRVLQWIRDQGYLPVVAHPERYSGLGENSALVQHWRDAGAFLQVNYGSIVGRYGSAAQAMAFQMLEAGLADYLASDFHGQGSLKIYKDEAWAALERRAPREVLETLCRANPARLIEGLEPLPVLPLQPAPGIIERIRGAMRGRDTLSQRGAG